MRSTRSTQSRLTDTMVAHTVLISLIHHLDTSVLEMLHHVLLSRDGIRAVVGEVVIMQIGDTLRLDE